MKYVIVYGSKEGQAIGTLDKYNTMKEAEIALSMTIKECNKEWKVYWIQKEYIYDET